MAWDRLDGRNGKVWRAYSIRGWTQQTIAEEYGITQERVSQILSEVRASIPPVDKSAMIQESLELIRVIKDQALEIAEMNGAPVAVGKDGSILYDPITRKVVRDYSGRLRAYEMALKADEVLSKRLGLDAATKTESTATVRYTLEGIDPEALK